MKSIKSLSGRISEVISGSLREQLMASSSRTEEALLLASEARHLSTDIGRARRDVQIARRRKNPRGMEPL
jgi:hypothetical protein